MAAPPSSVQLNVEPPTVEVNAKVADVEFTVPAGPEVIDVSGAAGPLTGPTIATLST